MLTSSTPGIGRQNSVLNAARVLVFLAVLAGLAAAVHQAIGEQILCVDFYIYWRTGRAAFLERQNPYNPEVARAIQEALFQGPPPGGVDPMLFAYPPYGLLPVLPFLPLSFGWAQAGWLSLCLLLLAGLPRAVFPRAPWWMLLSFLFVYPLGFTVVKGNLVFLLAMIFFLAFALEMREGAQPWRTQLLTGLALAWTTIKPQFAWLFLLFFFASAIRRRRWALIAGFTGDLAGLCLLSFWLAPSWAPDWLNRIQEYAQVNRIDSLAGEYLGLLIRDPALKSQWQTGLWIGFLGITVFILYRWLQGKAADLPVLAWLGLVTYLFDPRNQVYEQLAILLPVLLWLLQQKPVARRAWIVAAILVGFYWGMVALIFANPVYQGMVYAILPLYLTWLVFILKTGTPPARRLGPALP